MIKYLLIFLLCVSFAWAQGGGSWIVGGKGTGSGKSALNGGVYNPAVATYDEAQGNDGTFRFDDNAKAISNAGGSTMYMDIPDGQANANWLGVGVYFHNSNGTEPDARAEIINVNTGASPDVIQLEIPWIDGTTADVTVGGALANPGDVWDSDNASTGIYIGDGETHKIWIRALADYVAIDESDSILYVNVAGSAGNPIIWEGHFAEITTNGEGEEIGDFGIVTFNASGKTNAIETSLAGGVVYHTFIGISCENATDDGANLGGVTDDNVVFIRCQFVNNSVWGLQGGNNIRLVFCDLDTNGGGGIDVNSGAIIYSIVRTNTGKGVVVGSGTVLYNLVSDNTLTQITTENVESTVNGNTIDGNNAAGQVGIINDSASARVWFCINNIITDCPTGIRDNSTLGQSAVLYNNLYNSNTADTNANIFPTPIDGDNWGNLVKNVAENVLWTADDNTYILQSAYKQAGVDAFYTKAYWDDFNGGAGDNPPSPLSGLSFMDMGAMQRRQEGRSPGIGSGIGR